MNFKVLKMHNVIALYRFEMKFNYYILELKGFNQ